MSANFMDERLPSRFWDKVQPCPMSGCWIWTATYYDAGYGSVWDSKARRVARSHRVAYEALVGPIPDGLQLDHLCRIRACCNPAHLEPVTSRENTVRGSVWNGDRCKRGHAYTDKLDASGKRKCWVCEEQFKKRYALRAHAAVMTKEEQRLLSLARDLIKADRLGFSDDGTATVTAFLDRLLTAQVICEQKKDEDAEPALDAAAGSKP